jgi:hypothetical protein
LSCFNWTLVDFIKNESKLVLNGKVCYKQIKFYRSTAQFQFYRNIKIKSIVEDLE